MEELRKAEAMSWSLQVSLFRRKIPNLKKEFNNASIRSILIYRFWDKKKIRLAFSCKIFINMKMKTSRCKNIMHILGSFPVSVKPDLENNK